MLKKIFKIIMLFDCLMMKTYPTYLILYFLIGCPIALIFNGFVGLYELIKEKEFTYEKYKYVKKDFKC